MIGCGLEPDASDMCEVHLLRGAQMGDEPACGCRRRQVPIEPESGQTVRAKLVEQARARALDIEGPRGRRRHWNGMAGEIDEERVRKAAFGHDDLFGSQHRNLVSQVAVAVRAFILGGGELTGRQVEKRRSDERTGRPLEHDRQEIRRLTRFEITGVGERAGRHHANDLALDDATGFPGIFDLLADRDAKSLANQPREVAVDGVIGNTAHRNRRAITVLRARGQRDVERARRHEGVLEEHLVEVTHAKEQDGVAVLSLGVEVLAHGGCHRRGRIRALRLESGRHEATGLDGVHLAVA